MKTNMMGDINTLRNQNIDNQGERNYILRTHMKMNENSTYEHDIDVKKKETKTPKIYQTYLYRRNVSYESQTYFSGCNGCYWYISCHDNDPLL